MRTHTHHWSRATLAIILALSFAFTPVLTSAVEPAPAPSSSTAQNADSPAQKDSFLDKTADVSIQLVINGLSALADVVISLLGQLIIFMFDYIVLIAQYNNFTNAEIVRIGWPVVRDLVNMFFVMILIVISFATVLRIEAYSYQRLLPRLVIIALLVNFSKLITGLIIDFSQVIMITFVNSFKDIAGKAFYDTLRISDIVKINNVLTQTDQTYRDILVNFGGKLFGLLLMLVIVPVLVIFGVILMYRIVMLWMLTILSPLAFFSWIFSGGGGGGRGGGH